MDAYGDSMQVDEGQVDEGQMQVDEGQVDEGQMEMDEGQVDAPPHPSSIALSSRDRGMFTRKSDGKRVRVATKMTKRMFEARSTRPGTTPEERKADIERSKQDYLRRYGIRDPKTGELRFPNMSNPADHAALHSQQGIVVMTPSEPARYELTRGYGFTYPAQRRRLLEPERAQKRIPIDRPTHTAMMKIEKKNLATRACMMPLINIVVPTPILAAYLVDMPFSGVMDSFDLLNIYHTCFLILTAGHKIKVPDNLAFLTEERVREIREIDAKADDIGWPLVEKALTLPRGDLPDWFLRVLRQAYRIDKGHFLVRLKTSGMELAEVLIVGRKMDPDEAERMIVRWSAVTLFDMIGRTLHRMNSLCRCAYDRCWKEDKLSPSYLRELYNICERATFDILTAYDLTFLRILSRYIPEGQLGQFAPRYRRVPPDLMEPREARLTRNQRNHIAARRAHFLAAVPMTVPASNPGDLVWPGDPSSPTWSDMAQYHCFITYTPEADDDLGKALDGIYNSVETPGLEDSGARDTAPKRGRPKQ